MFPACLESAALIFAGITSGGGLTGLVIRRLSTKAAGKEIKRNTSQPRFKKEES